MTTRTTPEQRQRIAELRERNWSIAAIAAELGMAVSTAAHWCLALGVEAKRVPAPISRRKGPVICRNRTINPFTEEDDALITALAIQRFNLSQIARHLTRRDPQRPRSPATIRYRLMTIARNEERYGARDNG